MRKIPERFSQFMKQYPKIATAYETLAGECRESGPLNKRDRSLVKLGVAIGSGMGGMAGVLVGLYYNAIFPTMGYIAGIKAFAAAVLGGIGSVPGAMLGGGVLGIAEVMGAGYISSEYRDGISYAVMIAVILFKPSGLIGRQTGEKV